MRLDRDGLNFLVLVGLSSVVGLYVGTRPHDPPKLASVPSLGLSPTASPIDLDAQPPRMTGEFAPAAAPVTRVDGRLDSPFCPPPGETETIRYKHTLAGWLRRLDPDDDEVRALLKRWRRGERASLLDSLDRLLARTRDPVAAAQLWSVRAVVLRELGRVRDTSDALLQAYRADPTVAAIAIEAGLALRHTEHLVEAWRALAAYQKVEPQPSLKRTVALLEVDRDLRLDFERVERDGLVVQFTTDGFDTAQARLLADALSEALDGAARLTGLPRRESLTAVVYPAREELLAATCVRSWTAAVYDGTLRLVVARGTSSGIDLKSLRHEALHAQAIPHAPAAPRWFHEGLADLFAGDEAAARPLWKRLADNGTWIPAASLEGSLGAIEAGDSAQLAYAQSLAMVAKLVEDAGEPGVRRALELFHEGKGYADVVRELRVELEGRPLLDWMSVRARMQ